MADNFDIKGNAQKSGPKKPSSVILYVNKNKQKDDNKPSLVGYITDKELNLYSITLWKNRSKDNMVYFKGNFEDLAVKQNVLDMPTPAIPKNIPDDDILS